MVIIKQGGGIESDLGGRGLILIQWSGKASSERQLLSRELNGEETAVRSSGEGCPARRNSTCKDPQASSRVRKESGGAGQEYKDQNADRGEGGQGPLWRWLSLVRSIDLVLSEMGNHEVNDKF